jgi:hypothetical protein
MDVFTLRNRLIQGHRDYVRGFVKIAEKRFRDHVTQAPDEGALFPEPLIQLNPAIEPGGLCRRRRVTTPSPDRHESR